MRVLTISVAEGIARKKWTYPNYVYIDFFCLFHIRGDPDLLMVIYTLFLVVYHIPNTVICAEDKIVRKIVVFASIKWIKYQTEKILFI